MSLPSGFNVNLFYSYVKNKIVRGSVGTFAQQGSPKHQLGGGITYNRDIPNLGELGGNINATYQSLVHLDEFDTLFDQKGYAIVNARIGISNIRGSGFGVAAFANNITNTYYKIGGISLVSGGPVSAGVGYGADLWRTAHVRDRGLLQILMR